MKDCVDGTFLNGSCYKIVNQSNWFDAVDQCKYLGGNLVSKSNLKQVQDFSRNTNMPLFWLYDDWSVFSSSQNYRSVLLSGSTKKVMYNNVSRNGSYGDLPNETWPGNMSGNSPVDETFRGMIDGEGSFLCPAFYRERIVGVNCSKMLLGVCDIPGKPVEENGK